MCVWTSNLWLQDSKWLRFVSFFLFSFAFNQCQSMRIVCDFVFFFLLFLVLLPVQRIAYTSDLFREIKKIVLEYFHTSNVSGLGNMEQEIDRTKFGEWLNMNECLAYKVGNVKSVKGSPKHQNQSNFPISRKYCHIAFSIFFSFRQI